MWKLSNKVAVRRVWSALLVARQIFQHLSAVLSQAAGGAMRARPCRFLEDQNISPEKDVSRDGT